MKKTKIIIAGIGGVGGYFGGLLAKEFHKNEEIEICFLSRGKHLEAIQKNGLKVRKGETEFIASPTLATDKPELIGEADLILICTKSYDMSTVLEQLKPCVNKNTILLPLLNGVDSKEKIKSHFPDNLVLEACVYIVSRLKSAGEIENSGNIQSLYFGLDNETSDLLVYYQNLFLKASIDSKLTNQISTVIWEKFIFLSPTATITSALDVRIGELLSNNELLNTLKLLIEEILAIALAKRIMVSTTIVEQTLSKLKSLPFETTTSMHTDFKNSKTQTELETLTGFVIREGQKLNIQTPTFLKLYQVLLNKETN